MQAEPAGEPVDIGDGWTVPSGITIRVDDHGGHDVELAAEYRPDSGKYEAAAVTVRRRDVEVTGEVLRLVPVAGLLREGVVAVALQPLADLPMPHPRDVAAQGPTDDTLRWVARAYRLAVLLGDPPTRRVSDALGIPRSTASSWATRARDRGFLTVQDPRGGRRGQSGDSVSTLLSTPLSTHVSAGQRPVDGLSTCPPVQGEG